MSEAPAAANESPDRAAVLNPVVLGLVAILTLEFVGLVVVTALLVVELFVANAYSEASGIALVVLTALAALWVAFMVVGVLRGRSWTRSAVIVWEFVVGALGIGAFEGVFRVPWIGWLLLVPAVVALVLVFLPPATRLLQRREEPAED